MQAFGAQQRLFDTLAIAASALCLVHCLALPVMLVLLPTLAAMLVVPEAFHVGALAFAIPTSAVALIVGYRRHRSLRPGWLALPALLLLGISALAVESAMAETLLSVAGAVLLSVAHLVNGRSLMRPAARPD